MRTRRDCWWVLGWFLLCLVACSGGGEVRPAETQATGRAANASTAAPAPKPGFPNIGPNEMWIQSIPSGLTCFVTQGTREAAGDQVSYVFTASKKGTTPLLLSLAPGDYEVGLAAPEGTTPDAEFGPRFESGRGLAVSGSKAVYFDVVKEKDKASSFIGLAFSNETPPQGVAKLYPSGANFTFDEQKVRAVLAERGVTADEIDASVELLKRGGKILLSHKSSAKKPTTIEVMPDGSLDVVPRRLR